MSRGSVPITMYKKIALAALLAFFFAVGLVMTIMNQPFMETGEGINYSVNDSRWYRSLAIELDSPQYLANLLQANKNVIGPVVWNLVFGKNTIVIYCINFIIMAWLVFRMCTVVNIDPLIFSAMFFLNPIVLSSLICANKEFFGLAAILVLIIYIATRRNPWLVLALVLATLARLEYIVIIGMLPLLLLIREDKRIIGVFALVIGLSFVAPFISNTKLLDFVISQGARQGLSATLQSLQDNFLYVVVWPFKVAKNLFGEVFAPITNVYYLFGYVSQVMFLGLLLCAMYLGRIKLAFNWYYLFITAVLVLSINSITHHRYVLILYPFLLMLVLDRRAIRSKFPCRIVGPRRFPR